MENSEKYESDMANPISFNTYKKGDTNRDGKISLLDLVRLKKNIINLTEDDCIFDLVTDGKTDGFDLVFLRETILESF